MAKMFGRKDKQPVPKGIVTSDAVLKEKKEDAAEHKDEPKPTPPAETERRHDDHPKPAAHPAEDASGNLIGIIEKNSSHKGRLVKRPVLLFVALLIVVALGSGAYIWTTRDKTPPPKLTEAQAAALRIQKEYQSNSTDLQNQLKHAKTAQEKSSIYAAIAENERTVGKYDAAFTAAKQGVEAQPTSDSYAALALAALQVGNKQAAADAYQKASELATGTKDRGQSGYDYYQTLKADVLRS